MMRRKTLKVVELMMMRKTLEVSGVAMLGHTGTHALATRGCAPPV